MAVKGVTIRIEEEMLEKLKYVAAFEGRSANSHTLVLIRDAIASFEKKNGPITGKIPPQDNVLPTQAGKPKKGQP